MTRRAGSLVLILSMMAGATGCVSNFQSVTQSLPSQARIGVVVTNGQGSVVETSEHSYVLNAVMDAGYVPVALNEFQSAALVRSLVDLAEVRHEGGGAAPAAVPGVAAPEAAAPRDATGALALQLTDLREHLVRHNIQAVLVVYAHTYGFDEDLRAVMIRTTDMAVVGSRFYRQRVMTALIAGLMPVFAVGGWLVPWFYLRNPDPVNYQMVRAFVNAMGGAGVR